MKLRPNESIRKKLPAVLVPHSQFKQAFEALDNLFSGRSEDGYVDGLYITGPTGVGKTFLRQQFLERHPPYDEDGRTVIPIVSFSMPTAGGGKALYQAALAAMEGRPQRGTEAFLEQRLVDLLRGCGTQVLFVDEAQHFVQRNGRIRQERAADNVKALMNLVGLSVVLMGTDQLRDLMGANEQLRRRFSKKIKLREWSPYHEDDLNEVASVLNTFLSKSEADLDYTCLLNRQFVRQLVYGSGGRIGFVVKLLVEACLLAQGEQQRKLTSRHFEQAFQSAIWDEAEPTTSPFSDKFIAEELNGPNQPFWVNA